MNLSFVKRLVLSMALVGGTASMAQAACETVTDANGGTRTKCSKSSLEENKVSFGGSGFDLSAFDSMLKKSPKSSNPSQPSVKPKKAKFSFDEDFSSYFNF